MVDVDGARRSWRWKGTVTCVTVVAACTLAVAVEPGAAAASATPRPNIFTVAGGWNGDGGPATAATVADPEGLALDATGAVFVAQPVEARVRRITAAGVITTVAGNGESGFSGDRDHAMRARLDEPSAVAVGADGSLYVADSRNRRIRQVWPDGRINTVAGGFDLGVVLEGVPASQVGFGRPVAVALDRAGNLFVADAGDHRVRRISPFGVVVTVAGTGEAGFGGDGGRATAARLWQPSAVVVDGTGALLIADRGNRRVRRVSPAGVITTVAGSGRLGHSGDGGPATAAGMSVDGVAVDGAGNLYVADAADHRIRKVSPGGIVTTVAGTGTRGYSGDGGPAAGAQFDRPSRIVSDPAGNLYVSDTGNHRVRKVATSGIVTTIAGHGDYSMFFGDGEAATTSALHSPSGLTTDAAGNLYVSDTRNHRIRKVSPGGIITTVAGTGVAGFGGDGGPATAARLDRPADVTTDRSGNLFIADMDNRRIRKVSPDGIITTIAGTGLPGSTGDGGPASEATLTLPTGVAVDGRGAVFVADAGADKVRRIAPDGVISTLAGTGRFGFSGDGGPARDARLNSPMDVAVSGDGPIVIADTGNSRVRAVFPDGVISTIAGRGVFGNSGEGQPATRAELGWPAGLAFDATGSLHIADAGMHLVRRIALDGTMRTVAGSTSTDRTFTGDGGPAIAAGLWQPLGVTVDEFGNVLIADTQNHRVRLVGTSVRRSELAPLPPTRLLDTRPNLPPGAVPVTKAALTPGQVLPVDLTNAAGLPRNGVAAVSLNVTVTEAAAPGHLTVHPCDQPTPTTSNLNYTTGQTIPNAVITPVSRDGRICLHASAPTHVVVDLNAWFPSGGALAPLPPTRVLDTRPNLPAGSVPVTKAALTPGQVLPVDLTHVAGLPRNGVAAVSLNVTVTEAAAPGHLTVHPCDQPTPTTSNLNYTTGQTIPNAVITPVSRDGRICLHASAPTHVVVDLNAWFPSGGALTPALSRLLDTRPNLPPGAAPVTKAALTPGQVLPVDLTHAAGLPRNGVAAVSLNVTVTEAAAPGHLTVHPCDQPTPTTSNLNYTTGQTIPNAVITPVSRDGRICLRASAPTHVVVDLNGIFLRRDTSSATSTGADTASERAVGAATAGSRGPRASSVGTGATVRGIAGSALRDGGRAPG